MAWKQLQAAKVPSETAAEAPNPPAATEGPDQAKEDDEYIPEVDAPTQVSNDEDSDAASDEDKESDDNKAKDDGMNQKVGRTIYSKHHNRHCPYKSDLQIWEDIGRSSKLMSTLALNVRSENCQPPTTLLPLRRKMQLLLKTIHLWRYIMCTMQNWNLTLDYPRHKSRLCLAQMQRNGRKQCGKKLSTSISITCGSPLIV